MEDPTNRQFRALQRSMDRAETARLLTGQLLDRLRELPIAGAAPSSLGVINYLQGISRLSALDRPVAFAALAGEEIELPPEALFVQRNPELIELAEELFDFAKEAIDDPDILGVEV